MANAAPPRIPTAATGAQFVTVFGGLIVENATLDRLSSSVFGCVPLDCRKMRLLNDVGE